MYAPMKAASRRFNHLRQRSIGWIRRSENDKNKRVTCSLQGQRLTGLATCKEMMDI
jgi:hypothetical protein